MWLLVALGCGSCHPGPVRAPAPATCATGDGWDGEAEAFRDASADWGLDALVPAGIRFNAVDFDGDGWVDLAVRKDDAADDLAAGTRSAWLLRNVDGTHFEDVTEASGIRQTRAGDPNRGRPGATWVWADVDNDGDLDVYTGLAADDVETPELLLNQGDGTFALGPEDSAAREPGPIYAATFTDVDRDGNIDLFLGLNYEQDRLLMGDGAGGFVERTGQKGLMTEPWGAIATLNEAGAHSAAWASVSCDLDDDGDRELLVSSYGRAPNHLWRLDGAKFSNQSIASGYAWDPRVDWTDNESARCWCTLHPTDTDCDGVPPPEHIVCTEDAHAFRWDHRYDRNPYRLGGNSGQTVCADVDNDGAMDLLTSEIVHWDVGSSADPSELLINDGAGVFERPGNEVTGLTRTRDGVSWDDGDITGEVFDFDNDGWPDVYIGSTDYEGTRGLLYRQVSPLRFEAVPKRLGVDQPRSHGSVAADFDRDGDLDLVVGHSTARCAEDCLDAPHPRFFENLAADTNWLQVEVIGGAGSNAAAIGARVVVTAGEVTQTHEVDGGGGQYGDQTDLVQHFGLGSACEAEVTVRWPDEAGTTRTFRLGGGARWIVAPEGPPARR